MTVQSISRLFECFDIIKSVIYSSPPIKGTVDKAEINCCQTVYIREKNLVIILSVILYNAVVMKFHSTERKSFH